MTQNVHENRPIEEWFEKTKKLHQGEVGRPQPRRQTKRECEVEFGGEANQHKQGGGFLRGNAAARGFEDAAVSNGRWEKPQAIPFWPQ